MDARRPEVLVVEDEYLMANALQTLLEGLGVRVIGPVGHVSDALDLIDSEQHIDCALVDVKLGNELGIVVADALVARGIRFAFMTCYDRDVLPKTHRSATAFNKVTDAQVLFDWVLESKAESSNAGR